MRRRHVRGGAGDVSDEACPRCGAHVTRSTAGPLRAFAACPGCHAVLVWRDRGEWVATDLPTAAPDRGGPGVGAPKANNGSG
jgi:endogenous inhibitor of DNA gyrase (YacG/DUF329 family)